MPRLVACPGCSVHVKLEEGTCPACGRTLRDEQGRVSRTAGAVLMGLALVACGDKDDTDGGDSSGSGSETSDTGTGETGETGEGTGTSGTSDGTDATGDATGNATMSTDAGEAEYGVPDTGLETDTSTTDGTDTGTSDSTDSGVEPDYGVAETSTT
jgi:hypothetical protein